MSTAEGLAHWLKCIRSVFPCTPTLDLACFPQPWCFQMPAACSRLWSETPWRRTTMDAQRRERKLVRWTSDSNSPSWAVCIPLAPKKRKRERGRVSREDCIPMLEKRTFGMLLKGWTVFWQKTRSRCWDGFKLEGWCKLWGGNRDVASPLPGCLMGKDSLGGCEKYCCRLWGSTVDIPANCWTPFKGR